MQKYRRNNATNFHNTTKCLALLLLGHSKLTSQKKVLTVIKKTNISPKLTGEMTNFSEFVFVFWY
jgi:hypothetical protein